MNIPKMKMIAKQSKEYPTSEEQKEKTNECVDFILVLQVLLCVLLD